MPLTPDAKKLLAETIRGSAQDPEKGVRARLLRAIHDEADRRYRLSVPIGEAGLDEAHRRRRERIEAWIDERYRTAGLAPPDAALLPAEARKPAPLVERVVQQLSSLMREGYKLALIDEFQDTDPVQYRIFRELHARAGIPLFLIGDPKQAIYAFRGADLATYLAARTDAGDGVHALSVNYRSEPAMIDAVNAIFSNAVAPFAIAEIAFERAEAAQREDRAAYRADARFAPGLRIVLRAAEAGGASGTFEATEAEQDESGFGAREVDQVNNQFVKPLVRDPGTARGGEAPRVDRRNRARPSSGRGRFSDGKGAFLSRPRVGRAVALSAATRAHARS